MTRSVTIIVLCIEAFLLLLIGCSNSDSPDSDDSPTLKAWGMAEQISESDYSVYPDIGMAEDGRAIAVWLNHDSDSINIWARCFDGGIWDVGEMVGIDNGRIAKTPQIAVARDGKAIAIWAQSDGTRGRIWANRFNGYLWSTAEVIDVNDDSNSSEPQIAITDDGSAIAVWRQDDGSRYNIWANQFDGNIWGTAHRVSRNDLGSSHVPRIAMGPDGSAIVVWYQLSDLIYDVWANRFNNGVWSSPQQIEDNDSEGAGYPDIAVANDGSAIAVWLQATNSQYSIWANRFHSGTWSTPLRIDDNDAEDPERLGINPRIAFAPDGSAISVWKQSDGVNDNIWANRFDGHTWGIPELIENIDVSDSVNPQIAMAVDGSAMAVWQQSNGVFFNIWANRFDGSTWGLAELIENNDSGDAAFPQIAVDSDGNNIAVWHQQNGTRWDIWSNRFE